MGQLLERTKKNCRELFGEMWGKWQRRLTADRTEPRRLCHYAETEAESEIMRKLLEIKSEPRTLFPDPSVRGNSVDAHP